MGLHVLNGVQEGTFVQKFIGGPVIFAFVMRLRSGGGAVVLVFAINANAEDQKRKKGFREKGLGRRKGGNGRTLGAPYPQENEGKRKEQRSIQTISREIRE